MIQRLVLAVLLCLGLVVLSGCSKRHRIQIESDGCWDATVNGDQNFHDCGNTNYRVVGTLRCVRVRLTSQGSTLLRVRIDDGPWASTPDQFGIVQVCD